MRFTQAHVTVTFIDSGHPLLANIFIDRIRLTAAANALADALAHTAEPIAADASRGVGAAARVRASSATEDAGHAARRIVGSGACIARRVNSGCAAESIHLQPRVIRDRRRARRLRRDPAGGRGEPAGADEVLATFDKPQRAVTPGQSAVFYDRDEVVGGGWII